MCYFVFTFHLDNSANSYVCDVPSYNLSFVSHLKANDKITGYQVYSETHKYLGELMSAGHPVSVVMKGSCMIKLRSIVGEVHWKKCCTLMDTSLKQKERKAQTEYKRFKSMRQSLGATKKRPRQTKKTM